MIIDLTTFVVVFRVVILFRSQVKNSTFFNLKYKIRLLLTNFEISKYLFSSCQNAPLKTLTSDLQFWIVNRARLPPTVKYLINLFSNNGRDIICDAFRILLLLGLLLLIFALFKQIVCGEDNFTVVLCEH